MDEKPPGDKKNDGKREKKEKRSVEEKGREKKDDKKESKKSENDKQKHEKKYEEDKKREETKGKGKTDDKSEKKDDPKKDGKGLLTSGSNKTGDEKDDARSWFSPHILIGLLLLLPLLVMAGRSRIPIIYDPAANHPSILTSSGLGGILASPVMAASKGLKRATTSPRASSSGARWVVSEQPEPKAHIHINNVNSQGNGNPINIGEPSSKPAVEVTVEESSLAAEQLLSRPHSPPVLVEERVWEPISFRFTGPANPDRLWNMFFACFIVALPLIVDRIMDYPERRYSQPDYLSPASQLILLGALFLICAVIADWHFGWSSTIAPIAEVSISGAQNGLTPLIVSVVETSESLIWSLEDIMFGDGRVLLGMGLAALGVVLFSQRQPSLDVPKTDYAPSTVQAMYFLGALLIGMFVWNA